ncbi:hypothetical protein [Flavobacterium sp.]|uniref:hypothetical protein n=1 Tax=Flavobacterium sp. TaxID=239 RepID=UPI003D11C038
MKQKSMIYFLSIAIILFLVYTANVSLALGLDTFFINLLPKKEVPKEFANYKKLSEIKNFSNHTIVLFHKGEKYNPNSYCQVLAISKEKIILKVITKTEPYDHGGGNTGDLFFNTLFKMDSLGNISDTLNYKTSSSNQSEFGDIVLLNKQIVNKDLLYYQSWPTDGNKTKKDFIPINKDFTWDTEKLSKYYYDTILPNCTYLDNFYAWRDKSIPVDKRESIMYFTNNQWYVLYGVGSKISNEAQIESAKHNKKVINENAFGKIPDNKILFRYFQKLDYNSNVMGRTESHANYTYYYWDGIAYVNILFANDTLKFKREDVFLDDHDNKAKSIYDTIRDKQKEMEDRLKSEYGFYTNPNLDFTFIHDKKESHLYLVKKIKPHL